MSKLTLSEGLGSQMQNVASLFAVAKKTGHGILFLNDWTVGKGMQLPGAFDRLPVRFEYLADLPEAQRQVVMFDLNYRVAVDSRVFELDATRNYDILQLLNSYRYWYPAREEVRAMYRFRPEIVEQARAVLDTANARGRQIVAVHVRRTDFLQSEFHVNLSADYYANAFAQFRGDNYVFLVFSDDIAWCRQAFSRRQNVVYAPAGSQYVDMCAMSLCDHNITANSSFSGWGAILNANPARRVVCPARYSRSDELFPYTNHAWFPDDWLALDDLCI